MWLFYYEPLTSFVTFISIIGDSDYHDLYSMCNNNNNHYYYWRKFY